MKGTNLIYTLVNYLYVYTPITAAQIKMQTS